MFALVDVNNMYVSCERVFRPALNGKPVVVLSNNDGACIARSNEAKDLGVKMAQPWFQVKHLERSAGLIALSANFELYGDMSNRMMVLAAGYAPRQEVYSIDECFLDFEGVPGDLTTIGRELRSQVLRWLGLPVSVGLGPTKTLAKLANHVAKTADRQPGTYSPHLSQVCNFGTLRPEELDDVMRHTDVGNIWGIGRKTAPKLREAGIRTVLDLKRADALTLGRQFSVVMQKTVRELQGMPCLDVDDDPPAQQQIMCSRSFGDPVTALPDLIEVVSGFATRVAQRLREQGEACNAVHVFIATSPYRRHDRQHSPTATLPLPRSTSDTRTLVTAAVTALRAIYQPGYRYAKAGVMLVELQSSKQKATSLHLFDEADEVQPDGRRDLMATLDALNERFGRDAVGIASAGRKSARSQHASRQERRSPRSTTRLDEIIVARA
ncbi:MAG: Y-family DNA polymerase [Caldimonas sp.]